MKPTKILKFIIIFFMAVALFRFVLGNGSELSIYKSLKATEAHGNFYDYDKIFVDIQLVKYSSQSLVNGLKANNGATYIYYEIDGIGSGTLETYEIINKSGEVVHTVVSKTDVKGFTGGDIWDTLASIGPFFQYIGDTLKYFGFVLFDVRLSVIQALFDIFTFLYYLLFT